jgi:hypothetical protein
MGFLSPLLLMGLIAAALPLVIHLIGKQRAQRVPFAALDFLLRHDRRLRRRLRMRQLLLLALRVALVCAIALMLARPYAQVRSVLPTTGTAPIRAVLVIDDTASMAGRHTRGTLFDEARRRALTLVDQLPPGSLAAVLRVTKPSQPLARLAGDRRQLRRAIGALRPTAQAQTLDRALTEARLLLRAAAGPRHIFVFSDMARTSLPRDAAPKSTSIVLHAIDVSSTGARTNRAVVSLRASSSSAPGHRSMQLRARVCRYSTIPGPTKATRSKTRAEELSLIIDGKLAARGKLQLPHQGCADKVFDHTFARAGVHRAVVELEPDAFTLDDRRHLQLEVAGELRLLLVNGEPSPLRHADELFYLRTALETVVPGQQQIVTRVLTPAELARAPLSTFDAVVLANVEDLSTEAASALAAFVRGGGGLLVSVGSNTRATRYARRLATLLPQPLRGAVSPSPSAGTGQLRLGRVDTEHPLILAMGGSIGLRKARFSRVFRLRPSTALERRVPLRYDDGSPLLVEGRYGAGRTMLLTTTLDRDWTDLPIRPGYLPLMQAVARHLAGAAGRRAPRSLLVGASAVLTFPRGARRLLVTEPREGERGWDRHEADAKGRVTFVVEGPGFYRVGVLGAAGKLSQRRRDGFAVNLDRRESDVRQGALPGAGRSPSARAGGSTRRVPLAHGLGIALLLLLLGESWLTRRG